MCVSLKKPVSIFVLLTMLAMMLFASFPALATSDLPAAGDKLYGFTVTEVGTEVLINAPKILFEHDKTGAQVLYIAADDIDCSFDISFKTPNLNSKGISHVFEHICISGSEKYPAQNMFFPLVSQTYNTFVNAMTAPTMTTYPLSSMSEDQLLAMADYYLDGVFHPLVYKDERFFKREAWRYTLEDKDAPLALTGTVYNEMRGNDNIYSAAHYALKKALFPDSIISNVNGGAPAHIPEMTYQELLDFHQTYYHPSNSLTVLYGNMDYTRFLEKLDAEYFSGFDRREVEVETGEVAPQTELVSHTEQFAVEQGSPADNASVLSYGVVANGISGEDTYGLQILAAILSHDASPLSEAMRVALPNATVSVSVDRNVPVPYCTIDADGVDADDAEIFYSTIQESFAQIAEEGFDADIVDAVLAAEEFSNLLTSEVSNLGVNLSISLAQSWSVDGSLDSLNQYLDALEAMRAKSTEGYFEGLLADYIAGNPHAALITTVPVPGLAEENAAALEEKLAGIKAAMSADEIDAMVQEGIDLEAWSQEEPPRELLDKLQAVTADTLPEEYKQYAVQETERDGVRYMTAEASVGNIGSTSLYLDTSAMPQDLLHTLSLYTALIGRVDTENHARAELQTLITRYLNGFSAGASGVWFADFSWKPYLSASWMSLNDEYETGLKLVDEVLFTSRVDDLDTIQSIISEQKVSMRSQFNNMPYILQIGRAESTAYESSAYNSYLTGLAYYDYLSDAEKMIQDDPEALIASLETVRELLRNKQDAVVMYAGNEQGIALFEEQIGAWMDGIPQTEIAAAELALPKADASEGIIVDSTVQYNLLFASNEELGIEYSGKLVPLRSLIYDGYTTPQLRHGLGAYDSIVSFGERGMLFVSYRDPEVAKTFAVYEGLADYAANAAVTQEDLDRYIVSAYSAYVLPQGELSGATGAMALLFQGWPEDLRLIRMREIKSATVEDLRALAPVLESLAEKGVRSTSGAGAVINQNKDLYETIINTQEGN